MNNPVIKLKNVSVVYDLGRSNETWALKDISLEIFPEEFVIFFGPSGCGKSTLLNVIAGLENPIEGEVIVNDRNLSGLNQSERIEFHRRSVGIIFQAFYLIPELDVRDNIILPMIFAGERISKENVDSLMQRFEIDQLSQRYPNQLSGGQQQRVAIARALINNPPVILADEPTGNLDSRNAEIVMNLISELNQKDRKTIILVTHDPKHLYLADKVFYVKDGQITRVAANKKRSGGSTELEQLSRAFPYLSDSQLKAKLILNHLFLPGDFSIQQKLEEFIQKYIEGKITDHDLLFFLDETESRGGVNFYHQSAQRIAGEIKKIAEEMKLFEEVSSEKPKEEPSLFQQKIISLRQYILDKFPQIKLDIQQVKQLDIMLSRRINGEINDRELFDFFNQPVRRGGLGINRRTAKKIMRELEVIVK